MEVAVFVQVCGQFHRFEQIPVECFHCLVGVSACQSSEIITGFLKMEMRKYRRIQIEPNREILLKKKELFTGYLLARDIHYLRVIKASYLQYLYKTGISSTKRNDNELSNRWKKYCFLPDT